MPHIKPTFFKNRPAASIANDCIEAVILTGGGHIASIRHRDRDINPLWEPAWPSIEPALRRIADEETYGEGGEVGLLSSIMGHNLCVDVFGFHSPGEEDAGMTLHGESGMVTWEVTACRREAEQGSMTLNARLPHSQLQIERTFHVKNGEAHLVVDEALTNLAGFERAIGRQQHATLGRQLLSPSPALFSCNADKGMTFGAGDYDITSSFKPSTAFDYPNIPLHDGGTADWRIFPLKEPSGDLCTLRIRPEDRLGWVVAVSNSARLAITYVWEREHFPWLMTWQEDRSRGNKPWNGKEITRGLEFGSYAFPTNRRDNVGMGELMGIPAFEWLDAYETKSTQFMIVLEPLEEKLFEAPVLESAGAALVAESTGWRYQLAGGG